MELTSTLDGSTHFGRIVQPSLGHYTLITFEFSLGATYGTFRRELEREAITLIPFTCVDTFRGHLEKVGIVLQLELSGCVNPISCKPIDIVLPKLVCCVRF